MSLSSAAGPAASPAASPPAKARGNPDLGLAPRCGARTRAGCPCQAPAIRGKPRCRMHGGRSTGPRTAEGLARLRAARTVHGAYGAWTRAVERYPLTAARRGRVVAAAGQYRKELPPDLAARLRAAPPELLPPPYPTSALTRTQERLAQRAERNALAPWRQAIAEIRQARRAALIAPVSEEPHAPIPDGERAARTAEPHAPVPSTDASPLPPAPLARAQRPHAPIPDGEGAARTAKPHAPVPPRDASPLPSAPLARAQRPHAPIPGGEGAARTAKPHAPVPPMDAALAPPASLTPAPEPHAPDAGDTAPIVPPLAHRFPTIAALQARILATVAASAKPHAPEPDPEDDDHIHLSPEDEIPDIPALWNQVWARVTSEAEPHEPDAPPPGPLNRAERRRLKALQRKLAARRRR